MIEKENFQSGEETGSEDDASAKEDVLEVQSVGRTPDADEVSAQKDAVEIDYFEFLEALELGETFNDQKIIIRAPGSNTAGVKGAIETRVQGVKADVNRITDFEDLEGDVYFVEMEKY